MRAFSDTATSTRRFLRISLNESWRAKNKTHFMGATITRGGAVLAKAANVNWGHAEARAIGKAGDCSGATIYVVRRNLKVSRPCAKCWELIKKSGIKRVVYIGWDGDVAEETI